MFRTATTTGGAARPLGFALGLNHPPEASRIPSVCEIADRRMHAPAES